MTTHRETIQEDRQEQHVGTLVAQLSNDVSRLVRDELQLAKAELKDKGKEAGLGIGLFGGAGREGHRMTTTQPTETEALRADLELTRQHLADTVQQLSYQLNVPRRIKESASSAGHRAVQAAGTAGERAKQVPAAAREHPKAAAAVGGAVALGVGAAAWIVGRGR